MGWKVAFKHVKIFVVANWGTNLAVWNLLGSKRTLRISTLPTGIDGSITAELSIYSPQDWNAYSFPVSFFLAVDYQSVLERYGNRGFQMVQMWVGQISQHLSLTQLQWTFFYVRLKASTKRRWNMLLVC